MLHQGVAKSTRNLFPVVYEDGKLAGIILLGDVREIMFDQSLYNNTLVESLMHNPPDKIIYDKDSMQTVMQKFQDSGAWNLPVIKNEKYIGFVSKSKLLTAYRNKLIEVTS